MSVGPGMMAGTVSSAAVASSSSAVARAVMMMHQGMNQTSTQIQATFLFQCFERTLISPEPFSELFRFITWIRKVQSNRNSPPRTQTDSLPIGSASPVSVSHQQTMAQATMLKVIEDIPFVSH